MAEYNVLINFDVDAVVSIEYRPSQLTLFTWYPETRIPRKFLGFDTGRERIVEEGWYDLRKGVVSDYERSYYDMYTLEDLLGYDYIVENPSKLVFKKPYVKVILSNKDYITKSFDTEDEALSFIIKIKSKSNKTFEVIKY
jgi:hypothetical protein